MSNTKSLNTPIGTLNYTFITGEGRENLSGVAQYSTQIVLTAEEASPILNEINALWATTGIKKDPKSLGYKTLESGEIAFNAKTNVEGKYGRTKVKTFDGKGKEFDIGQTMIGNGTKARLGVTLSIYEQPSGSGVTIYLNKIQIIEMIEYTGGDGEAFEEVSGGYTHTTEFEAPAANEQQAAPAIKKF